MQPAVAPPSLAVPTQDERTLALLAHMLQILLWWIGPLTIFLIKRNSKFVSFHALQALLLQGLCIVIMIGSLFFWIFLALALGSVNGDASPPPEFYILRPMFSLSWIGIWIVLLIASINFGFRAGRGEWAEYPVLGRMALKILKLGPTGLPL
jgi:uncharacterized membrane protein